MGRGKVSWRPRRIMDSHDPSKEGRDGNQSPGGASSNGGRGGVAGGDVCPLPVNRFAGRSCVLLFLVTHELGSQFEYRK